MKTIQIKHLNGSVLYEHTREGNTFKLTVEKAVQEGVSLQDAFLQGADLRGAFLRYAFLRYANLQSAFLQGADLRYADLRGAFLEGADLRHADLRGAILRYADLNGEILTKTPLFLNYEYKITITEGYLRIGCQRHTHEEWKAFTDEQIHEMDGEKAVNFWSARKDEILKMCEGHRVA